MIVVDASIVVRLLQARASDELLRQRLTRQRRLDAPTHLDVEVLSAIHGLRKGGKVDAARARRMLDQFTALRIDRHDVAPLGGRMLDLGANFTMYDAAYIALAEGLSLPLLTWDAKFARAPSTLHQAEIQVYAPPAGASESERG